MSQCVSLRINLCVNMFRHPCMSPCMSPCMNPMYESMCASKYESTAVKVCRSVLAEPRLLLVDEVMVLQGFPSVAVSGMVKLKRQPRDGRPRWERGGRSGMVCLVDASCRLRI